MFEQVNSHVVNGRRARRRRIQLGVVGLVAFASVGVVGCGSAPSADPAGSRVPGAPTPDLASGAHIFEPVTRFGDGRAVMVVATDSVNLIVTTIGVDVRDGDMTEAVPTSLPSPLADAVIAADGGSALLVAQSGAGELWTLASPRLLASFDSVVSARFAADSSSIDVVGAETVVRVSTVDGSTTSEVPRESVGAAVTAWFGLDAHALVIARDAADGPAEIWTGSDVADVGFDSAVVGSALRAVGDPTGDRVVLGLLGDERFSGSLASVDMVTGEQRWSVEVGEDAIKPVWDVGHDGRVLVVVGQQAQLIGLDGALETSWDLEGTESVVSVTALGATPGYVIERARGSLMFVDADGVVIMDSPTTGKRLVDLSPVASGGIIAADVDGLVREWTPAGDVVRENADYVAGSINDVAVSADGMTAAAAASDGNLAVLDLGVSATDSPMPRRFVHPEGNVDTVAFVPDGTAVMSGISEPNGLNTFDDTMSRWDLASDDRRFAVGGIPDPIMGCTEFRNTVRLSPDGEFFVAPFHDFSVSVRSADDGSVIHEFPKHISIVWGLAIAPDGSQLATSSDDWTLRVWDLDDYHLVSNIEAPPGGFLDVVFAPDGRSLIVSDISGKIHVLDLETESLSAAFDGAKDPAARLSVSPDGLYVAAGSHDGADILIWEMSSGRIVQELPGHAATVNSVEFTPDGRGLVSGSDDGTARLWRVA